MGVPIKKLVFQTAISRELRGGFTKKVKLLVADQKKTGGLYRPVPEYLKISLFSFFHFAVFSNFRSENSGRKRNFKVVCCASLQHPAPEYIKGEVALFSREEKLE